MDSTSKQSSVNQLQEQIRSLTEENVQLRERNEGLFSKLDAAQNKLGQQAASKSDLSVKLVQCEEDKLKISKDLVDVQIEANKMREQYEAEIFELKNMPEEFEQSKKSQRERDGAQSNLRDELEKLRKSYEGHQRQLEEKVAAMGREQQENKRAIQTTRHELSQQSAALIISQHRLKEAEAEASKLQNHLKELNREYRARLTRYIQDVTECVSAAGDGDLGRKLKGSVESMLEEVKASHRSREEQLTKAVRTSHKRIQGLSNTYQQLLIAYRLQREQILALPEHALEAGPPEAHFSPAGTELRGETERELHRLREDKDRLESQLKLAREQMAVLTESSQRVGLTQDAWNDVQKQIRELTSSAQEAQERERAHLITRVTVAEAQVSELKEYVDNHLGRYKLEITRLRRLLGSREGRSKSARTPKPRPLHQSLKSGSYEI
ncbi:coiled-coil domain-containing protein 78 isoform X3 [Puntigrus tetrazona]|uniref:coiled-coil domain-containing protein 78 isoform X3 n=1 Tax=Puntigrus tetrazona TaxID=1606681 RepID=UPI001C8AEE81|nr:coiled-coil domain-containing protein 78 isoform X3 [Puntigrus tetrazona]